MVGSGILGLPFVIMNLGIVPGIITFMIIMIVNYYTTILMLKTKNLSRHSNFCSIGKVAIGG